MDKKKSRLTSKTFLVSSVAFILVGAAALYFFFLRGDDSFPDLPHGSYVGTLTLDGASSKMETLSLYLERFPKTQKVLFVVFDEGYQPQPIQLVTRYQAGSNNSDRAASGKTDYEPLSVTLRDIRYRLAGSRAGSLFSGDVIGPEQRVGEWKLRPLAAAEAKKAAKLIATMGFDLAKWLEVRAELRLAVASLEEVERQNERVEEQFVKLESYIDDEDTLKQRAQDSRDGLREKVDAARTERKKRHKAISKLVSELDLLSRITERGKVVRIGRKVAGREEKWYQANWKADASANVEAILGDRLRMDVQTLRSQLRKAREVKALLTQIRKERVRILELNQVYQDKIAPHRQDTGDTTLDGPTARGGNVFPRERSKWGTFFRERQQGRGMHADS